MTEASCRCTPVVIITSVPVLWLHTRTRIASPSTARSPKGAAPGGDPRRAGHHGRGGRRLLGDREVLGHDVLRRPRALRLHERGLRSLRPRERAAARHVPEPDQVRGRDHRDDPRRAQRRRGDRRAPVGVVTTGGTGSILHAMLAYREYGAQTRNITHTQRDQARDRAPRVRQGLPSLRHRAAQGPGRPEDHAGRRRLGGRPHRRQHRRPRRLGVQLRLRHGRPDGRAVRPRVATRRGPARRQLSRRLHPAVRAEARLRRPDLRLPAPGRHQHLGRHAQVRLRVQGLVGLHVPRQEVPQRAVLLPHRLERRQVLLARHRRLTLGRFARGHVGGDGQLRVGRLPALRQEDLRDVGHDAGRGALAS